MSPIHRARVPLSALAVTLALSVGGPVHGQSASIGADVVSRYIWRGTDFGESMSVQPALTLGLGGLEVGAWASYAIAASGAEANENDLWATYTVTTSSGASVSFGFTDYYFPAPGSDGFFVNEAHMLELSLGITGPENFPVSFFAGMMTRNDPDNSLYLEASMPVASFEDVDLGLTAGMVAGESEFYGTEGAAFVNLGVSASKDLRITDSFALPVSVSYILNTNRPDHHESDSISMMHEHEHEHEHEHGGFDPDRAFLVFAVSLVP